METFDERLNRFIEYIHDNYVIDDINVLDILENGIRYLATHVDWRTHTEFSHIIYEALLEGTRLGISEEEVWLNWMPIIYSDCWVIIRSSDDGKHLAIMEIDPGNDGKQAHPDEDIVIVFYREYKDLTPIKVSRKSWNGILNDKIGKREFEAIKLRSFYTVWENQYYEEEKDEI